LWKIKIVVIGKFVITMITAYNQYGIIKILAKHKEY